MPSGRSCVIDSSVNAGSSCPPCTTSITSSATCPAGPWRSPAGTWASRSARSTAQPQATLSFGSSTPASPGPRMHRLGLPGRGGAGPLVQDHRCCRRRRHRRRDRVRLPLRTRARRSGGQLMAGPRRCPSGPGEAEGRRCLAPLAPCDPSLTGRGRGSTPARAGRSYRSVTARRRSARASSRTPFARLRHQDPAGRRRMRRRMPRSSQADDYPRRRHHHRTHQSRR